VGGAVDPRRPRVAPVQTTCMAPPALALRSRDSSHLRRASHRRHQHPRNQDGAAREVPAPRRGRRHPPPTEHAPNQVGARARRLVRRPPFTPHAAQRTKRYATLPPPRRQRDMRGIKTARRRRRQLQLPFGVAHTWGGARKGAGRKPRGRPSMPHGTRPKVDPRYPVQVTIRATPGLPSFRSPRVFGALRRAIARASVERFRVIHFSIQQDHGHFIVEGDEARRARGGMHGLAIRLALAGQPGPRAQGAGGRRPLPRPRADHAAPDENQHGLCAAQLPQAPAGARVRRPAQLGTALWGMAARARSQRRAPGHGAACHVDGARRLETRRWSVASRGAPRLRATTAPNLNSRMLARGRRVEANLNSRMFHQRRARRHERTRGAPRRRGARRCDG
jgi:hypothetical protein